MIQGCDVNATVGGRWNATFSGWMWSIGPFNLNGKEELMSWEAHRLFGRTYFLHITCFLPPLRNNKVFLILIWFLTSLHIHSCWMCLCFASIYQPYKIPFWKSLGKRKWECLSILLDPVNIIIRHRASGSTMLSDYCLLFWEYQVFEPSRKHVQTNSNRFCET